MVIYLYDGSFEGLLSAIHDAYYVMHPDYISSDKTLQLQIGDTIVTIDTHEEKAKKVLTGIYEKLGVATFKYIYQSFLSEAPSIGFDIYQFLKYAFKKGPEAIDDLANVKVDPIRKASTSVMRETHLLVGLVRFKELTSGIFYASVAPKYQSVTLLADHFAQRMNDQLWVIHDVKRSIAVIYDKDKWYVNKLASFEVEISESEAMYQRFWKEYFETIAIKERVNPRLQKNMMPKYYWDHLVEIGPNA